jgi:hypothetical protein
MGEGMGQTRLSVWRVIIAGLALLLGVTGLRLQGRGLRMRLIHRLRAVLAHPRILRSGDFTNVIFLHHSTGRNLIRQGGVRELLTASGFQFWDHDYNPIGLTLPDGTPAGYSYVIPDENTAPEGLASLFAQTVYPWPVNAFSGLMQHEVIAFKSCFPVSNITSDEQLETYKAHYLSMRDVMGRRPDRIFIVLTPPPLNPSQTDAEAAARARAFSNWLTSNEYLSGHPNVFTFDFFDYLAEEDPTAPDYNMLREAYRDGTDSHPNAMANETIGPRFADFVINAIPTYRATWLRSWPPSNTKSN